MSRGSISHHCEYIPNFSTSLQNISSTRLALKIRQQPVQARLSTNNEKDRKLVDPPPIVQINLENSNTQETQDFLQNPYLFMSVSLVHSVTHEDVFSSTQNTLSGQTVSSMYKLKDINNQDGGFFVFGDLSVKLEGQFKLKFTMFEISQLGVNTIKSVYSNAFQVHSSKTFPGMLESTFLSRSFSDQGVRIRIRKEHRVQINSNSSKKRKSIGSQDEYPSEQQQQRRRSSAISSSYSLSSPVSPPHQHYDHYYRLVESDSYYQHSMMIPSPPQTTLLKTNANGLAERLTVPIRRQSADAHYASQVLLHEPRRLSLQHTTKQEVIHLPPLRSMLLSKEGEVDAAVAMMELSSSRNNNNRNYYNN